MNEKFPELITTEAELNDILTRPREVLINFVRELTSPLIVLGAGGKMGPTLAVLARRAAGATGKALDVIAVSRFTRSDVREWLEDRGVRTIRCDLMDRRNLTELPDAENVIYMVGLKFGTTENPAWTWAVNTLIPAYVSERYADARITSLSTGNVYPLVPVDGPGSSEEDPLTPRGEYANSCVARERIFEFSSVKNETPMTLIRLSYALDLRYGVLVDIARKVYAGERIDVTMGYANAIWQGDANEIVIRSLGLANVPAVALNVTGPRFSLRQIALCFEELMGRPAYVVGSEANTAFLSDTDRADSVLGPPPTNLETIMRWTAHWVSRGGCLLDKPTHFEVRDGAY